MIWGIRGFGAKELLGGGGNTLHLRFLAPGTSPALVFADIQAETEQMKAGNPPPPWGLQAVEGQSMSLQVCNLVILQFRSLVVCSVVLVVR